jgi:thiol-disulfide isomerase/thioredoxin
MSTRYVQAILLTSIMVLMSLSGMFENREQESESEELLIIEEPKYAATSPGHTVFAEYVGADWCPPCQNGGSPSMHALKTNFPSEFTYLSYFESGGAGVPDPLNRRSHVMYDSTGIPTASFGDANTGTYHPSGASTGTSAYDSQFSSGGDMKNVNDYSISLTQTVNGANMDIDVTATYLGSASSVTVYVLAVVTEETCPDTYNDGTTHPHNVIKKWLLNSGNNGFQSLQLSPNNPVTTSWQEPISTVRSYGSASAAQNFNTVVALMNGPHSTYNDVFVATDAMMNPMDLSVTGLTVTNNDATYDGFLAQDILSLEATVENTGTEDYSAGGSIQLYHVDGATENPIGQSVSLNNLNVGQTQSISTQFDTTGIQMNPNGKETFRVRMMGTTGENDPVANNRLDVQVDHDYSPSTDTPVADGQTSIARGSELDFDVTGNARDAIDTLETMTPEFETSPTGLDTWSSDWVIAPSSVTAPGTPSARYVVTVDPIQTAASGDYDVRARLTDSRGQQSDWSSAIGAFSLENGLPIVVDPTQPENTPPSCSAFPGAPQVKVDTNEFVSISGLVCDAETPLSDLQINSQDPAFIDYHSNNQTLEVKFTSMQWDSNSNPLPQGISLTISDGEDSNTGTLFFDVIENGQPRWSSVPAQSFDEGIGNGVSISLANSITDTSAQGTPTSIMGISITVEKIEPQGVISGEIFAGASQTLTLTAIDDDAYGTVVVTVRATDSDGQWSETDIFAQVNNVNDAPRFDSTGLDNLMVQKDKDLNLELKSRFTDVDNDDNEIWVTTSFVTPPYDGEYLNMRWTEVGMQTVTITAQDSSGASDSWNIDINVVDMLPLIWSTNGTDGDIDVVVDDLALQKDPTLYLIQLSELELSNIVIVWSICNYQTGICTDFGSIEITQNEILSGYTFSTVRDTGNGMETYDELKLHVEADDTSGFDRKSSELGFKISIDDVATGDGTDEIDEGENQESEDSAKESSGGMDSMVLVALISLVVLFAVAGTLVTMLLRGGRGNAEEAPVDWNAASSETPLAFTPVAAPSTQSVPDYTHLTPGGQYVSGHAGETVYLSPDGTAWTMQADSSFIRTS